jgi:hypothetical protein
VPWYSESGRLLIQRALVVLLAAFVPPAELLELHGAQT